MELIEWHKIAPLQSPSAKACTFDRLLHSLNHGFDGVVILNAL
jgi:hypothetical protein